MRKRFTLDCCLRPTELMIFYLRCINLFLPIEQDPSSAFAQAALALSLELSVAMEEVNCKLSALLEKVDLLKKSVSRPQSDHFDWESIFMFIATLTFLFLICLF